MHLEKFDSIKFKMAAYRPLFTFTWPIFRPDKIQNGRLSAIIHFHMADIWSTLLDG